MTETPDTPAVVDEPAPEQPRPLRDGEILVRLTTDDGEADLIVPPMGRWKSSARNALMTRGDDMAWAVLTLSDEDAETWLDLDPTKDDTEVFFQRWRDAGGGESANRATRRAEARRLRAVS